MISGFRFGFKPTHREVNRLVWRRKTVECLITSMLSAKRNLWRLMICIYISPDCNTILFCRRAFAWKGPQFNYPDISGISNKTHASLVPHIHCSQNQELTGWITPFFFFFFFMKALGFNWKKHGDDGIKLEVFGVHLKGFWILLSGEASGDKR